MLQWLVSKNSFVAPRWPTYLPTPLALTRSAKTSGFSSYFPKPRRTRNRQRTPNLMEVDGNVARTVPVDECLANVRRGRSPQMGGPRPAHVLSIVRASHGVSLTMSNTPEHSSTALPLVFACAGCSHAGRLAYDVALQLERQGVVKMSCLAGVGARKSHFLKQLQGRTAWVIDGCPIECAAGVFDCVNQKFDRHIRLQEYGVRKNQAAHDEPTAAHLVQAILSPASNLVR